MLHGINIGSDSKDDPKSNRSRCPATSSRTTPNGGRDEIQTRQQLIERQVTGFAPSSRSLRIKIKGQCYMLPPPDGRKFDSKYFRDFRRVIDGTGLYLRSYHARDHCDIIRLYHQGLLTGAVDPMDNAADLDDIEKFYFSRPQDHFWIAEIDGKVVGSIATKEEDEKIAHIRRLRVDPAWKLDRGAEIASVLIQMAADHARQHDCLKLILHTPLEDERAIAFLHQLGFEYARTKRVRGRHLLEFYVDLYARAGASIAGINAFHSLRGSP